MLVNNLKEEKGPLLDHLHNMDKHVKTMYKELLDEAASQRKLHEKNIELNSKSSSETIISQGLGSNSPMHFLMFWVDSCPV